MKSIFAFIFFAFILQNVFGQVETKLFPNRDALNQVKYIRNHPKPNITKILPIINVQKMIDEDQLNEGKDLPFRFGKGFDSNISLTDGSWVDVENGRLWSMEFQSKGAYSINFVFDNFYLPDSAKLYITNTEATMLYGPVTSKQNTKNGYFLTDLVQGENVRIYLFEPSTKKGQAKLTIKSIIHAYRDLFLEFGNLNGSMSCNNDIACFPDWTEESDAVGLVLLSNGASLCSGSLLMTANQSFAPYFLSAFHCIDESKNGDLSAAEISNAGNWMFKFQYKKSSCNGSTATTGIAYNGAEFRAAWNATDFVLVEMDNSPLVVADARFAWLGWDRSGDNPALGTGIHHPSGDVMKISFDNNDLTSNQNELTWTFGQTSNVNTH